MREKNVLTEITIRLAIMAKELVKWKRMMLLEIPWIRNGFANLVGKYFISVESKKVDMKL